MTHPTVQRIENAFGSETARRFEKATINQYPTDMFEIVIYMDELGKEPSVRGILSGAFFWAYTKEGFSYWYNLASPSQLLSAKADSL